jgi:cyclopropane fatty-acyl-phospholipid synthase-like methyltransferase
MPWWFHVVESQHELQNPTSAAKIRLLGERLGLGPNSQVLDMGSGRGGPGVLLAQSFGCHVTCVEQSEEFLSAAKERVNEADVEALVELVHSDGRSSRSKPTSMTARCASAPASSGVVLKRPLPRSLLGSGRGVS